MRLPAKTASVSVRLTFSRYTARRLRRDKLSDEEAEVRAAAQVLSTTAAVETEVEFTAMDVIADRDALDDTLDAIAKRHRRAIEGRGTNANRERPYTDIYPQGIAWYTDAPLAEQQRRYELLVRRYEEFLPEGDPVRVEAPLLAEALEQWSATRGALDQADLHIAMARAKTEQARRAWEDTHTRLYFRLAERFGKAQAERYFPRRRQRSDESASGAGET